MRQSIPPIIITSSRAPLPILTNELINAKTSHVFSIGYYWPWPNEPQKSHIGWLANQLQARLQIFTMFDWWASHIFSQLLSKGPINS
jgi:hypothetical protein